MKYLLARYPVRGEFTSVNDDKKFKKKTLKRKFKEDEDGPTSSNKYKSKAVIEDSDEEAQSGSESD